METFILIIKTVIFCFAATAAFGFIMSAPLKSIPVSSTIATMGIFYIYISIHQVILPDILSEHLLLPF